MKKVVVFGASGFIGKALTTELLNRGIEVIGVVPDKSIDDRSNKLLQNASMKIVECNLQDVKGKFHKLVNQDIDTCYFLAWNGLKNEMLKDYRVQIDNVSHMLDLMNEVKLLGCNTFIGAGSITQQELFFEAGRNYITDKHKYYRSAQQACDDMGRCMAGELEMKFIWPLITNVYGEGEHSPRFINTLIRQLIRGEDVPTSEGNQLYDFVYIKDAVDAYIKMAEYGKSGKRYIIGSGNPAPLKDFLIKIEKIANTEGNIQYGKFTYRGVYYTEKEYDISELMNDTGYVAETTFEAGIRNTIQWIRREEFTNGQA